MLYQLAGSHLLERGLIVSVSQPGQAKFVGSPNALYQFPLKEDEMYRHRAWCTSYPLILLFQNFSEKQANETAAAPIETNAPHAPPPGTLLVNK